MLLFDPENHVYTLNGRVVPSVTQCLAELEDYSKVPTDVLHAKAQLGTAVHAACELWLNGDLDEEDGLHPKVQPYFTQFQRWMKHYRFDPALVEQRVYSPTYGYAGTLDLFGKLDGRNVLIDIKTASQFMGTFGPQTAAYAQALREDRKVETERRYCLKLSPKGFELREYKDYSSDIDVFFAALTIKKWKEKYAA